MFTFIKLLLCLRRPSNIPDDYYEKELEALNEEHRAEQLSTLISHLILKTSELLQEEHPYPTSVVASIDELYNLLLSIAKEKHSSYYNNALSIVEKDISLMDSSDTISETILSEKQSLLNEFCKTGTLDIDRIQIKMLDRYFFHFREYWEDAISKLKRKSAVENRRKYLIELIGEFESLLKQRGIVKYTELLSDYRSFNLSELNSLLR